MGIYFGMAAGCIEPLGSKMGTLRSVLQILQQILRIDGAISVNSPSLLTGNDDSLEVDKDHGVHDGSD